jgi:tRNA-specific 2-thiouridylase
VDRQGRELGRHEGHHNYTVGQRRGLGIATPEPVYVLEKDAATNTVVVGSKAELATTRVPLENATLHRVPAAVETVRLRYHAHPIPCRVLVRDNGGVEIELERPAHAVAPGQLACLMSQDRVVGEGTIGEPR